MSISSEKTNLLQRPGTYLVGLVAALHTVVVATAGTTTTACDGWWGSYNEGSKGHSWQERRCAEEHFS